MNGDGAPQASWRPVARVVSTLILFATIGLAIELALAIGGYILISYPISSSRLALALYAGTAYGIWLVHPLYLLPAIGLYLALRGEIGRPGFEEAALIAALLGVLWAVLLADNSLHGRGAVLIAGAAVIATLICWKLARWSRRRGEIMGPEFHGDRKAS